MREGFGVGFPCLSGCVLLQVVLLFLPPPPPPRRRYVGGFLRWLSCHSTFFVSPPRHTGGTRQVFDGRFALLAGGLPYYIVSAFPSMSFLRVSPGFIARPFIGVGLDFEEPHLRLMV